MTVNWNPEDVQVSLTMDKGFKTVYSKNSINYPLMCSFLVMLAFHKVKYCIQCPISRYRDGAPYVNIWTPSYLLPLQDWCQMLL